MSHWKRAPHDGAFHRKRPASEIYRRRSTRCGLVYFLAVPPVLRSEIHDRPVKLGGNPLADLPGVCSPIARSGRRQPSQVLAQTLEKRMPDLPRRRLRAILDLGQELRFDPDPFVSDPLGIGLRLADQRLQPLLQVRGRDFVEAMVDFACVDQVLTLAPADVKPVPLTMVSVS